MEVWSKFIHPRNQNLGSIPSGCHNLTTGGAVPPLMEIIVGLWDHGCPVKTKIGKAGEAAGLRGQRTGNLIWLGKEDDYTLIWIKDQG